MSPPAGELGIESNSLPPAQSYLGRLALGQTLLGSGRRYTPPVACGVYRRLH
jgi:hypothetical protein